MIEREVTLPDGRVFNFHEFAESIIDLEGKKIYAVTQSRFSLEAPDFVLLQAVVEFTEWQPGLLSGLEDVIATANLTEFTGIVKVVVETVEGLKEAKRKSITTARDLAEKAGFPFMGKIIDSDMQSVIRIITMSFAAMVVILLRLTGQTIGWEPQPWTTADNSVLMIDTPEMAIDMQSNLMVFGSDLHARATALKAEVDAITSTDLEEVRGLLAAIPNN